MALLRRKNKILCTSLNSFKDENLAHTFQHTPEIQPTKKINKGENTLFSSNSMGKSFVSALMGIAISEGYVESIEDPLGKYIPEFVGTELENIPVRACLQMASGIDFDEDKDMSGFGLSGLLQTEFHKTECIFTLSAYCY